MNKILGIKEILEILPQRYPFLFIDKVLEYEPGKALTAMKNVTMNEEYFIGHFPGRPVMPGVLIIEAMGQAGMIFLEFGNKGTLENDLVQENFFKFTFGLSIYERWFVKSKYK